MLFVLCIARYCPVFWAEGQFLPQQKEGDDSGRVTAGCRGAWLASPGEALSQHTNGGDGGRCPGSWVHGSRLLRAALVALGT